MSQGHTQLQRESQEESQEEAIENIRGAKTATTKSTNAVNWPVFTGTAVIIVAFVAWAAIWPDQADSVIFGAMDWVASNFGWYYILTASIVVVFVVVVALSRMGDTRLGPDHSRPKFKMFTWAAMLFAAGIGVDLMFFGISGPATNYLTPPDVQPLSDEAARMAPVWTIFHYGIPGWAMYALMGMAFGLVAYRYHLPLAVRSLLAPIIGKRVRGAAGHTVEIAATIGTIFGISVSLGIGVVFLNYGLSSIFDIPTNTSVQVALMAVAVFMAILSTVSGVDKGIRRLSELNVLLAIVLLLWVLFTGQTTQLLNALVQNVGDFFSQFPGMMMDNFAYTSGTSDYPAEQWKKDWTLFFWAWWIAWAPFVSLFLARISRGRTLRQFVFGVLLVPLAFIILWVSIFGNAALGFFRDGDEAFLDQAVNLPEAGFFELLVQYPGATFTIALACITGLLFYVTSADSGSLVMANMTSKPNKEDSDGPSWLRIVWAIITGALTLSMLFIDGVYTLQAATVMVGLPLSALIYLTMWSVLQMLRAERLQNQSRLSTVPGMFSRRAGRHSAPNLRQRLGRRTSFASKEQATEYITDTAIPVLEEFAEELRAVGENVECTRGTHPESGIPYLDLRVKYAEQGEFKYQVYPVKHRIPNFAVNIRIDQDVYYKVEIFRATGSRGQDIYGYTREQIIEDVLDAYDAHVYYMSLSGESGVGAKLAGTESPEVWVEPDEPQDPEDQKLSKEK